MTLVPPDGPCDHPRWAIIGEAPAREEIEQGRSFVGASGRILWPLLLQLAEIQRHECYVTNLCKTQLDDDTKDKLTSDELYVWTESLRDELQRVRPGRMLAVGALAAEALLGDQWTDMRTCNGVAFDTPSGIVVPCWHPAAALRGDSETLAWTGAAIKVFRDATVPIPPTPPPIVDDQVADGDVIGIDTEGTVDDPQCLTWATDTKRVFVRPEEVPVVWDRLMQIPLHVYHNAPWDWAVLEAMGVKTPYRHAFRDTMELAYVRHTEPQALKDLAWRHFRLRAPSWKEVVTPAYEATVRSIAEGRIAAETTTVTHSPKTNKPFRKPKIVRTPEAKRLARRLTNTDWLGTQFGIKPNLMMVPDAQRVQYATLDPWLTLTLWKMWDAGAC